MSPQVFNLVKESDNKSYDDEHFDEDPNSTDSHSNHKNTEHNTEKRGVLLGDICSIADNLEYTQ